MKRLTFRAPAKLNLYLKVVNKRPDGYHNLKTLFERIDLADEITFSPENSGKIKIACDHPHVPCGRKNLIYQAAQLLKDRCQIAAGVNVCLKKRIPVAAGLAGGSSNAATTLLALNRMWKCGLSQRELVDAGRVLGADIPFFLAGTSWGLGTERGDRIRPLNIGTKLWHVVVIPRMKMYSREVFSRLNLQLTKQGDNVNILIRSLKNKSLSSIKQLLLNDLESSILKISPRLEHARSALKKFDVQGVSFSGSGPSVFAIVSTRTQAQDMCDQLAKRYSQVFVARTL